MKLAPPAFLACALLLWAQDEQLKHLSVPTSTDVRPTSIAALEIERAPQHPSVIHMKGSVEIKTPVCVVVGPGTSHVCAGYLTLRADAADFHEDSGQIEAHGNVTVTREK